MKTLSLPLRAALLGALIAVCHSALAAVSTDEAARLKSELTPLGAEKAGNKDGSIPAWTGGDTKPAQAFHNGGRRPDPFASEKPLYSITAKNMAQYADKLTDGSKAMLKKYPDTYRIDVYPTHRTAAAPQWVYDNTYKNATAAQIVDGPGGQQPKGAYGGVPFPIPKSGVEVMWNHLLRWTGQAWHWDGNQYVVTADGRPVLTNDLISDQQNPYYFKDSAPDKWNGDYYLIRLLSKGPAIRAGEGIVGRQNTNDDRTASWVYLTGQRRVRKLPNACCDTPATPTAGVMTFDELEVFTGRTGRFNWKLLGKKEIYVPYNSNRTLQPTKDTEVLGAHHLNPDHVRWELHRVWVVEATLREGERHVSPRSLYYIDEDSWMGLLADRWDAKGQLWHTLWQIPFAAPDMPGLAAKMFGFYDMVSGTWYSAGMFNEKPVHYKLQAPLSDTHFTSDSLAGDGVR
jgi:hypothetical protein